MFWFFSVDRKAKSEPQDPAVDTSKQRSSRSSPPLYLHSTMLAVLPSHCRRSLEMGKSHSSSLSSLADLTTSERRSSKAQKGSKRALSQVSCVVSCYTATVCLFNRKSVIINMGSVCVHPLLFWCVSIRHSASSDIRWLGTLLLQMDFSLFYV